MSKAYLFLILLAMNVLLLVAMFVQAAVEQDRREPILLENISLVRNLELTDLCLFTEARYARHLCHSDIHSALQDHICGKAKPVCFLLWPAASPSLYPALP